MCSACSNLAEIPQSPQYRDGRFHNPTPIAPMGFVKGAQISWKMLFDKPADSVAQQPIPTHQITQKQLRNEQADSVVYRLGHSSLLLQLAGKTWLLDPVFSERASPFQWAGPKRFHQPPIALEQLENIQGVVISHDHYDHLDRATIEQLSERVETFLTPLGVGKHLRNWGVAEHKIVELDWWQDFQLGSLRFTATPARHFSGRGLNDNNHTLWASWVIQTSEHRLFFSGDSGYFDGFAEIGKKLGPFDLTLMENGAYDADWSEVHMTPEQSLQAHLDLGGKLLMPIHNSTFDLALHPWKEPLERLSKLAENYSVELATPEVGERLALGERRVNQRWWQQL